MQSILIIDDDAAIGNLEQEVEYNLVLNFVKSLNKREREIMELRFGLNGKKEHTQKQVADLMGISQSYISRLEKRIIKQLKIDIEKVS